MHPTSLPSRFGIGDLGASAYQFVDFLERAGQTYWQVLPLNPPGYGNSPYQGLSAFAGSPWLISPERLREIGHLTEGDLADVPPFPEGRVDFEAVLPYKERLLDRALERFEAGAPDPQRAAFEVFCDAQAYWLDDFALFMALREEHGFQSWQRWPAEVAHRDPQALARRREELASSVNRHKYRQWQYFAQWEDLKRYANAHGVRIIGDIPIFVSLNSADVWANPHLFQLDEALEPTVVSGVPPDFFNADGQLWGHPLYRWDRMQEQGYAWWIARFRMIFTQADVTRIDHFRGFYNYWEIPAGAETAVEGQWVYGPGADLFTALTEALGDVPVIAEDLGEFDPQSRAGVRALRETFDFPGMKVLQFAFGTDADNAFLPHNFGQPWVAYTGTHDNDTVRGWYEVGATEEARDYARRYMRVDGSDIAWDLVRLTWSSVANTAITQVQDLLGLGNEARMNVPGTVGPPNWGWRLAPGALRPEIAGGLRELSRLYGRLPQGERDREEQV
jgi:4-alpha-glucanotransferase